MHGIVCGCVLCGGVELNDSKLLCSLPAHCPQSTAKVAGDRVRKAANKRVEGQI